MAGDRDRRTGDRQSTDRNAQIEFEGAILPCKVADISSGGARVQMADPPASKSNVVLSLGDLGRISARVMWRGKDGCGLAFEDDPETVGYILMDMATYGV